jgi:hypothetical protein
MCRSQLLSQQSYDLDMYLPSAIDFEDTLLYQSADELTHSFEFDLVSSTHRTELDLFDPITNDMEASSILTNDGQLSIDNNNTFNKYDVNTYLYGRSTVVPHIENSSTMNIHFPLSPVLIDKLNMSLPNSPLSPNRINIKKFLVFDETTGRERRPLLHEFLRLVLEYDEYSHMAEYIDRKLGIFKLHKPKDVSDLWKQVKGRNSDNSKLNFLKDKISVH